VGEEAEQERTPDLVLVQRDERGLLLYFRSRGKKDGKRNLFLMKFRTKRGGSNRWSDWGGKKGGVAVQQLLLKGKRKGEARRSPGHW